MSHKAYTWPGVTEYPLLWPFVAASWDDSAGYQTASGSVTVSLRQGDTLAGGGGGAGLRALTQQQGIHLPHWTQDRLARAKTKFWKLSRLLS